ncbi:MAG TPA: FtsX-like permease family protein [Thermoanaerobaculia bacterium]|nr:FtsX-like permease family protein [Thermoanaerobaculia bacterium]
MNARFFFNTLARESRGARGRLAFFVACLSVGVAAVVAVAGMSASLDEGVRTEARQLLAADLAIEGRRPLPADFDLGKAGLAGSQRADIKEMVTVVLAPRAAASGRGSSQLVELRVVDGDYPFYGKLELRPQRPLRELLRPDTVVVGSELLSGLGLREGGTLRVGGAPFRIAGVVLSEPDRVSVSFTIGPRVFLSAQGLARTQLEGRGSRVGYRTLIKVPAGYPVSGLAAAKERLERALPGSAFYEVETYKEAQPALRNSIDRVDRFLGLVALLSLFVGGIGVAQSVRAWLAGRLDAIAVLKCLGMRPRELFPLYLGQTALLGLAGSLVGLVLGSVVQLALPSLFPDLIPAELVRPWQPAVLLRGLALGVGVAVLFSLPPLSAVLRVPPARVLRRDAEPLPRHRWATAVTLLVLGAGIWGMAAAQSRSLDLGSRFTAGMVLVTAALAGAALLVSWAVRRLPRESMPVQIWMRHGLAALARPGSGTVSAIVALGLGVLVVLGMSLVERRLSNELATAIPPDAPSAFLIDVQPDQWPGVRKILAEEGRATRIDSVPVIMARIAAIDGRPVEQLAAQAEARRKRRREGSDREEDQEGAQRWALTREQRLTYMSELPADNRLVAGKLWTDPARAEVSVEEEFAEDLNLKLGSVIRFDVQGVPVELTVTSLRAVEWETFGINFFLVVEPGVLEKAPRLRLAAARLPRGTEQQVQDALAAAYPNVTLIRVREVLEKVAAVLERIGVGIRFLGGFTVLAGIAILAGAVSAGSARRGREVALLKTLGMTRKGVAAAFATEYALIGLVAGVIGTIGAAVLSYFVVTRGFELEWALAPMPLAVALAGTILLAVAAGLAASARALERRPIEVLRAE